MSASVLASARSRRRRYRGVFLYGEPGAGKSYLGLQLARDGVFRYADGDAWLPADLRAALRRGRGFSDDQRDRFARVIAAELAAVFRNEQQMFRNRPVVVAQALIKRRHREVVRAAHPDVLFVRVTAATSILERRLAWGGNLVDAAVGLRMKALVEADAADPVVDTSRDGAEFPAIDSDHESSHSLLALRAILRDHGILVVPSSCGFIAEDAHSNSLPN